MILKNNELITNFTKNAVLVFDENIVVGKVYRIKVTNEANTVLNFSYTVPSNDLTFKTLINTLTSNILSTLNIIAYNDLTGTYVFEDVVSGYENYLSLRTTGAIKLEIVDTSVWLESYLPVGFNWADSGEVRDTPDQVKKNTGWIKGEKPKHEWFNFMHNIFANISTYLESFMIFVKINIGYFSDRLVYAIEHIQDIEDNIDSIESNLSTTVVLKQLGVVDYSMPSAGNFIIIPYSGEFPTSITIQRNYNNANTVRGITPEYWHWRTDLKQELWIELFDEISASDLRIRLYGTSTLL